MIGSQLVIHGGIDGAENILIQEGSKSMIASEFALFDFQARYWMKIKQDELINEDTFEKTALNTTVGPLAYHTMTAVYESALSKSYPDAFYSRQMWVKTPGEILAHANDKPGHDRSLIKH